MTFVDPSRSDGVVEVELVAAPARRVVAGTQVELLTYNGAFPGPLLRFREGDRVRIRLTNRLGEPTTLHLHGLHIPPAVDVPMRVVADGDTIDYEFDVLPESVGTHWYHPHAHGSVGPQLFAGLAGPMVVDGRNELSELAIANEQILVLKDLTIEGSRVSPHTADDQLNGKEGELVLVNGEHQPHIETPSQLLRLRLINACNARYLRLGLEGHRFTMLGAGIGLAERATTVDTLLLAPGERADVVVTIDQTGTFALVALPYDRGASMSGMDMGGMDMGGMDMRGMDMGGMAVDRARLGNRHPITLATFTANQTGRPLQLPEDLASLPRYNPDEVTERRRIVFSEEMGEGQVRFLINGKTFDPGRIEFHTQRNSIEVWELVNDADMDHPFHLHVYPFIVMSRNGRPEPVRMWRDTVNLAPRDRVELLVPYEHFSGTTIYHCHIVEHEDRGMMAQFAVA